MKEYPIIFSAPMVQANHAGRKRMTRRLVKVRLGKRSVFPCEPHYEDVDGKLIAFDECGDAHPFQDMHPCPYGQPGDRLWVRETWRVGAWRDDGRIAIDYAASPEITNTPWLRIPTDVDGKKFDALCMRLADELEAKGIPCDANGYYHWDAGKAPLKWRPSIHMPRWACRDVYIVTNVRLERLQDITEADAVAEGCRCGDKYAGEHSSPAMSAKQSFMWLWQKLNDKRPGASWLENPWVWVVEYNNPLWKISGEAVQS